MKVTLLLIFSLMLALSCAFALANGDYRTNHLTRCEQELLGESSSGVLIDSFLADFGEDTLIIGPNDIPRDLKRQSSAVFHKFTWTRSVRGAEEKPVWAGTIDFDFGQMIVHAKHKSKSPIFGSYATLKFIFKLRPPSKTEIAFSLGERKAQLKILRNFLGAIYKVALYKRGFWSMSVNGEDLADWTLLFEQGTREREDFFSKLEFDPGLIMVTIDTKDVFSANLFSEMEWILRAIQKR